ncbi:hypothetical protein BDD12DRAFT_860592 [Trichophaea hybrida]|nr:hypothetical protein BDD12DRAFT_860592 [Trichophaea hybrida]
MDLLVLTLCAAPWKTQCTRRPHRLYSIPSTRKDGTKTKHLPCRMNAKIALKLQGTAAPAFHSPTIGWQPYTKGYDIWAAFAYPWLAKTKDFCGLIQLLREIDD